MTERVGGSDVRNTETLATYCPLGCSTDPAGRYSDIDGMNLGPWVINGFKWFSSATDANMAILPAKTPEGGISAFYPPTRRTSTTCNNQISGDLLPDSTLNGITIQ